MLAIIGFPGNPGANFLRDFVLSRVFSKTPERHEEKIIGMPQVQPRNNLTLLWIACVAVILFCATGVAAIMGWLPTSKGDVRAETTVAEAAKPADIPALNAPAAPAFKYWINNHWVQINSPAT